MHHLIPHFILEKYSQIEGEEPFISDKFSAISLFVDISGFTTMTETLLGHGQHGAEVLATVMRAVFAPLTEAVYKQGGFITAFAGDAFTALFPTTGHQDYERALAAGWFAHQHTLANPNHPTPYGQFEVMAKVGIAAGEVIWGIIRSTTANQAMYYFKGAAIDSCSQAEHYARLGDVVVSSSVYEQVRNKVSAITIADHFCITDVKLTLPVPQDINFPDINAQEASIFYPVELLKQSYDGEFRQVVNTFIRLEDGPSDADLVEIVQTVFDLQRQYGGYLNRINFGDKGFFLLLFWGAPTSYENDLTRALGFVLDLQDKTHMTIKGGITYRIAHAGFIGSQLHEEYTCYGRGVNLAARFMTQAPWGEIWLDEEIAQRAKPNFDIVHAGDFIFKGFATPQPVYRLLQRKEAVEAFYRGELVGRKAELQQLHTFIQPILEERRYAGILIVRGEAGIGKSRLVHEFYKQPGSQVQWFRCQTDQILRQFLHPFRYFLRRYFEQSATQTAEQNKQAFDDKLNNLLTDTYDPDIKRELVRVRSFLAALVDLHWADSLYQQVSTEARYNNTFEALKTLLKAESSRRPLVIQLEDIHWLDEDSIQFMRHLSRNLESFPIAIIATMRPQDEERIDFLLEQAKVIDLRALSARFLSDLTEAVLGAPASNKLIHLLAQQADGNPFFAEQILLYLQEQNSLVRQAAGSSQVTIDLAQAAADVVLPTDVRSVLVARLDRLATDVKQTVLTASVLGREFELEVLTRMIGQQENLMGQVDTAVKADVWSPLSGERYLFRHALLSDTAYNIQLLLHRRRLHQQAAEAIEALYASDLSPHFGTLVYHFEQAGDEAKTRFYLERAGDTAKEAYQNTAALDYYQRLITLFSRKLATPGLSESAKVAIKLQQADTLLKQGQVMEHIGRWADSESVYKQALSLIEGTTELARRADLLAQLGTVSHLQEHFEEAETHYQQALQLYEQLNDEKGQAFVLGRLSYLFWYLAEYDQALAYCQQGIKLCEKLDDKRAMAQQLAYMGLVYIERQEYEQALAVNEKALSLDEALGFSQWIAIHLANIGGIYLEIGEIEKSLTYQQRALQIHRELGYTRGIVRHLGNIANAYFYSDNYDMALKYLEQSLPLVYELGSKAELAWQLLDKVKNLIRLERFAEAKIVNEEGAQAARESNHRPYIFMAKLQEAQLTFHLGEETEAVQQFNEMLAEAETTKEVAELHYELWHYTGDIGQAQSALHYYRRLMMHSVHVEYRNRVTELETAVPPPLPNMDTQQQ